MLLVMFSDFREKRFFFFLTHPTPSHPTPVCVEQQCALLFHQTLDCVVGSGKTAVHTLPSHPARVVGKQLHTLPSHQILGCVEQLYTVLVT